jgi:uncharacterized repeat protein (TIGR03847 family)
MSESFELDPVYWITAGAVGEPGDRVFYVQAEKDRSTVALVVEKEQVRQLAQLAQELLQQVDITVTPDDLDTRSQQLREPIAPAWRAGRLALSMDPDGGRFMLEAEELVDDEEGEEAAVGRFWMSSEQLVAMAAHAAWSVEAGARETCRLCNRPMPPEQEHRCPALNGHGPLLRSEE